MLKKFPSYFYSQIWLNQLIDNHHLGWLHHKIEQKIPWFEVESGDFWLVSQTPEAASNILHSKKTQNKKTRSTKELVKRYLLGMGWDVLLAGNPMQLSI
jgi:hypothetical protein